MDSSTMVPLDGVPVWKDVAVPATLTTSPTAQASATVSRKLRASTCAIALGTIMSVLMSSSPTTRMDRTTVAATSAASTTLRPSTGRPTARAYSSSSLTA